MGSDTLLHFTYDLNEGVAQVHTVVEKVSTRVINSVSGSNDRGCIVSIKDTLECFNDLGAEDCYGTISRCSDQVRSKIDELKAKYK